MIRKAPFILAISLIASTALADTEAASYQNTSSFEENTGVISGAVLGALVGGPPGFLVGAAIGDLIGEGWRAKKDVGDLHADIYSKQLELAAMREEMLSTQREVQLVRAEAAQRRNTARLLPATLDLSSSDCCDNTVISLHFRSGSSAIEQHYEEQLQGLADIAQQMPNPRIEITGYADRNGGPQKNLALSQERSGSVKQFFNSMGVQNSSIQTISYGEAKPIENVQSLETDFFDRRVIVRLRDANKQMLTQTPDGN